MRGYPLVDPVGQSYATPVLGSVLVVHKGVPATGTTQVATVVNGQPQILDLLLCLFKEFSATQVRAPVFIAVTIRAIADACLQHSVFVRTNYLCQRLNLQIAYALWQPCCAFTGET